MNLKRCAISFALLAMVVGGALPASAENYRGTFTLPAETVWGQAVLEPGDYTVRTETIGALPYLQVEGNGKVVNILAGTTGYSEPSFQTKGRLELTEVNGAYVVTKLTAGAIGREFSFAVPRALQKGNFPAIALKKAAIPVSNTH